MYQKRGQSAAGAAVLLAIIMGLVIFYILVLHPDERAELLGETSSVFSLNKSSSSTTISQGTKTTLLEKSPGHLSYLRDKEIEKLIPSIQIYTVAKSVVLAEENQLTVTNSLFSSKEEKVYFSLNDLNNTKDVYLGFTIESAQGNLIILLNGQEIFNKETSSVSPLKLSSGLLTTNNNLTFKVSSPGGAFWRNNKYQLQSLKIVAQVTDVSHQQSESQFNLDRDEYESLQEATLKFSPDCALQDKGKLEVKLNNNLVFGGVPENCNELMYYKAPLSQFKQGSNSLIFKTSQGDYKINYISLKIKMNGPSYLTYYFDIGKSYFDLTSTAEGKCGEVDDFCPSNCDEDTDKDCCFFKSSSAYWCDIKTKNKDDRCVEAVDSSDCSRCLSGYEDKSSYSAKNCAKLCGDDTDGFCPSNCKTNYDKDCCFAQVSDQFWCADLPVNGMDFTCLNGVSYGECSLCPKGYVEEGSSANCPVKKINATTEEKMKSEYDATLTISFTDDKRKEAEIYVNGHKISFDTYKTEFTRNINNYVKPWSNSVKIVPQNSFDVREIKIELKS